MLAKRDLDDIEFFESGHFRFAKRDLLDNYETILFDSRVMEVEEGIDLHLEQERRRLAKRAAQGSNTDPGADVGEKIPATALPFMPALQPGYEEVRASL